MFWRNKGTFRDGSNDAGQVFFFTRQKHGLHQPVHLAGLALLAEQVIGKLIEMLRKGEIVDAARIRYAVALAREGRLDQIEEILGDVVAITHRGRRIQCKTLGQREYVSAVGKTN